MKFHVVEIANGWIVKITSYSGGLSGSMSQPYYPNWYYFSTLAELLKWVEAKKKEKK